MHLEDQDWTTLHNAMLFYLFTFFTLTQFDDGDRVVLAEPWSLPMSLPLPIPKLHSYFEWAAYFSFPTYNTLFLHYQFYVLFFWLYSALCLSTFQSLNLSFRAIAQSLSEDLWQSVAYLHRMTQCMASNSFPNVCQCPN